MLFYATEHEPGLPVGHLDVGSRPVQRTHRLYPPKQFVRTVSESLPLTIEPYLEHDFHFVCQHVRIVLNRPGVCQASGRVKGAPWSFLVNGDCNDYGKKGI